MATWNDLPMELRLMIFKVMRQLHFIERKDKLIELLKGRTVKIVETPNDTELYIYVQNERCSSRQLRTFFTKVIYCEYRWDASVEMTVLLMCHTSRLAIDVYNYEWNQEITSETIVNEWKAVLAQTRKSLYNSYEKQSFRELMNMQESI
jgi:hypothetical protein